MKIQEYKILAHIVHENVQYFQMLMHSSFWREVTETSNMNLHDLPIPHQQLLHHLEVLRNIRINLHRYYLFISQRF